MRCVPDDVMHVTVSTSSDRGDPHPDRVRQQRGTSIYKTRGRLVETVRERVLETQTHPRRRATRRVAKRVVLGMISWQTREKKEEDKHRFSSPAIPRFGCSLLLCVSFHC